MQPVAGATKPEKMEAKWNRETRQTRENKGPKRMVSHRAAAGRLFRAVRVVRG